ncbi:MAG: hypothetical protein V2A78_06395 [bacterium]
MKIRSRIYFNPVTKEMEIEGSESFVTTYFDKLQPMLPKSPDQVKAEPKVSVALPVKRIKVKEAPRVETTARKKVINKKGKKTSIDTVIDLIKDSPKGITTSELRAKTGFTPKKIWNIASRAAKLGKIKRSKLGTYVAAS